MRDWLLIGGYFAGFCTLVLLWMGLVSFVLRIDQALQLDQGLTNINKRQLMEVQAKIREVEEEIEKYHKKEGERNGK